MPDFVFLVEAGPTHNDEESIRQIRSHAMRSYRKKLREKQTKDFNKSRAGGSDSSVAKITSDDSIAFSSTSSISSSAPPPKKDNSYEMHDNQQKYDSRDREQELLFISSYDGTAITKANLHALNPIDCTIDSRAPIRFDRGIGAQMGCFLGQPVPNKDYSRIFGSFDWYFKVYSLKSGPFHPSQPMESWHKVMVFSAQTSVACLFSSALMVSVVVQAIRNQGLPTIENPECLYYKGQAIKMLREDLEDTRADIDVTIGAILCLCWAEVAVGGSAVETHLDAAGRLLDIDDQADDPTRRCISQGVLLIDIFHTICSNISPKFITISTPRARSASSTYSARHILQISPMHVRQTENEKIHHNILPQFTIDLINDLFEITEWRFKAGPRPLGCLPEYPTRCVRIEEMRQRLHNEDAFHHEGSISSSVFDEIVTRMCLLAGRIHFRAVVDLVPHSSVLNDSDVHELTRLLRRTESYIWRDIPFVGLWILNTGAATLNKSLRCFYVCKLWQLVLVHGLDYWDGVRANCENFMWLQRCTRQAVMVGSMTTET